MLKLQSQLSAVEGVDAEEVKRLKGQKEALENLCRTLTAQLKVSKAGAVGDGSASSEPEITSAPSALEAQPTDASIDRSPRQTGDSECLSPVLPLPPQSAVSQ